MHLLPPLRPLRGACVALLAMSVHLPALAAPACAAPAAAGGVRLNEILAGPARDWDGSGAFSSRDDEWIEILNSGPASVDLAGFLVTDGDSIPRYAFGGTLGPGETRLVTGKASWDWEKANGKPAFGLSLGNTGDQVILWQVVGADTVVVDAYAFKSHEAAADRSVGRSTATGEWQLFDALNPYTGTIAPMGNQCAPTPGAPNDCTITPARPQSWGGLKSRYR
jgi:hypothetical protein